MGLAFKAIVSGQDELMGTLAAIPERVQNRVFRASQKKVGKAVADRAKSLTPRNEKSSKPHLADSYLVKQKSYRSTNTTVTVVGARSGSRINHLVELGSAERYTHHRSSYRTVSVGTKFINRKVKTASGGWRTVKEKVNKTQRKSIGSVRTGAGRPAYRGVMPAFHQLKKAVEQTPVEELMVQGIKDGLQRIADRS